METARFIMRALGIIGRICQCEYIMIIAQPLRENDLFIVLFLV